MRPPHGSVDATSLVTLLAAGYTVALWSLDSCDYGDHDPAVLVAEGRDRIALVVDLGGEIALVVAARERRVQVENGVPVVAGQGHAEAG